MDLQGVAIQEGSQYQVLLGCDVLLGRQGVLAPAVIDMAGELRWRFLKQDGLEAVAPMHTGAI